MTTTFLLTSLVICVTPGTGALFTLAAGLTRGIRASVLAAFACTLGVLPHLLAAVTGLAALLHASALAFRVVTYLGVAYLLFMAWSTWRDDSVLVPETTAEAVAGSAAPAAAWRVLRDGVVVNLLNPKLTIFFFAFLPQFVPPGSPDTTARMLGLGGVFMVLTFVVFVGYGVFAAVLRRHVVGRPRVIRRLRQAFSLSFVALGLTLASAARA